MMNDYMFGFESSVKCADCNMCISGEGLISLCFGCEERRRNARVLRQTTIDNGTLPPLPDAPLLHGVARDPQMDKQIRKAKRKARRSSE